ncbi:hypothetical protein ACLB2K_026577 [Fragaria x ananassa]
MVVMKVVWNVERKIVSKFGSHWRSPEFCCRPAPSPLMVREEDRVGGDFGSTADIAVYYIPSSIAVEVMPVNTAIELTWVRDWKHIWISIMTFKSFHIFREGNRVADALANHGTSLSEQVCPSPQQRRGFSLPSLLQSRSLPISHYRMSEAPFRPREQLAEKQKYFQSIHKHTYLKGPFDKVTSVAIPAALAATSLFLIGRGIYNMSHGIGKKE